MLYDCAVTWHKIWNYFTLFYLVPTRKSETNFPAMRSLKNAEINLCTWSFSLLKNCCLNWSCLFALFLQEFFFAGGVRTSNMDETDSMVFRCSIYLFILLTNTKLLNYYISVLLNFYISNEFNKIHCKIYLLQTLN